MRYVYSTFFYSGVQFPPRFHCRVKVLFPKLRVYLYIVNLLYYWSYMVLNIHVHMRGKSKVITNPSDSKATNFSMKLCTYFNNRKGRVMRLRLIYYHGVINWISLIPNFTKNLLTHQIRSAKSWSLQAIHCKIVYFHSIFSARSSLQNIKNRTTQIK
jgi:hypothetical protein